MFSRTSQIWPLPFAGSSLGVNSLPGPGSNSWHFSWFCSWSYSCPVFGSTHATGKTLDPTSVLGSSIGSDLGLSFGPIIDLDLGSVFGSTLGPTLGSTPVPTPGSNLGPIPGLTSAQVLLQLRSSSRSYSGSLSKTQFTPGWFANKRAMQVENISLLHLSDKDENICVCFFNLRLEFWSNILFSIFILGCFMLGLALVYIMYNFKVQAIIFIFINS